METAKLGATTAADNVSKAEWGLKYLSFDKTKRDAVFASSTAWNDAYTAWDSEKDATKKAALLTKVTETQAAFDKLVGDSSSSGGQLLSS